MIRPDVAFTAGLISRLDMVLGLPAEIVVEAYSAGPGEADCADGEPFHRMAEAHVAAMVWAMRTVGGA